MAYGTIDDTGGVAAIVDVPNEGLGQWAAMSGYANQGLGVVELSGGPGVALDQNVAHIATIPGGTGPRGGMDDTQGAHLLDDWRDVFNFRGSPVPYILLFLLATVGFAQFRLMARVGKGQAAVALG